MNILIGNPLFTDTLEQCEWGQSALNEGLKIAAETRAQIGKILFLVDHKGDFGRFLDERELAKLSNRQKKRARLQPNMSLVKEQYRNPYVEILQRYGFTPEQIHILTEAKCKAVFNSLCDKELVSKKHMQICTGYRQCDTETCTIANEEDTEGEKRVIRCNGVAAGAIYFAAEGFLPGKQLQMAWNFHPVRTKPETIQRGTEVAKSIANSDAVVAATWCFGADDKQVTKTVNY